MASEARPPAMYVTYLETSGPFVRLWMQRDRRAAARVEGLLAEAAARLHQSAPPPPHLLARGQLLAASRRGAWYRARLAAPPAPSSPLLLRFVDFGHSELVAPADVRLPAPDSPELWREPAHAAAYLLARVVHPAGRWEEPVVDFLRRVVYCHEVQPRVDLVHGDSVFISLSINDADFADHLTSNSVGVEVTTEHQAALYDKYQREQASLSLPPPPPDLADPPAALSHQPKPTQNLTPARPLRTAQKSVSEINRSTRPSLSGPPTFKPRRLDVDSEHCVSITHAADGPEAFAVRLRNDEHVSTSIKREIERVKNFKHLASPLTVGTVCLAKFEDGSIRRAVIVKLINAKAELYSVDCGSTESASFDDIYQIPEELIAPDVLAPKFCLAGMAGKVVDERTRRAFAALVDGKTLTMRVVRPDGPPLIQYCELSLDGRSVKDLLLNGDFSFGFEKIDPARIEDGCRISVSSVDSCSKFYVRLLESDAELEETMERVEAHCSRAAPMRYPEMRPGAACCAFYPDDEKWYRAQILNVRKDRVTVKYVDYGNDEEVSVDQVKPIDDRLLNLRAQAVQCALQGYENCPFDKEAADRLEALTIETELRMRVCGRHGRDVLLVKLFDENLHPADLSEHLTGPTTTSTDVLSKSFDDADNQNGNSDLYSDATGRDRASGNGDWKNNEEISPNGSQNSDSRKSYPRSKNYSENKSFRRNDASARNPRERHSDSQPWKKSHESHSENQNFPKPNNRSRYSENKKTRTEYNPSKIGQRLIKAQMKEPESDFSHQDEYSQPATSYSSHGESYAKKERYSRDENPRQDTRPYKRENSRPDTRSYNRDEYPKSESRSNYRDDYPKKKAPYTPPKTLNNPSPFETQFSTYSPDLSQSCKIQIPWFISPNEFYVNILSMMGDFNMMMNRLPEIYKGIRSYSGYISNGSSVIVQNPDDRALYRAQVIESVPGSGYFVQYVDFGNKNIVAENKLWQVESELFNIPKMAIKCSLHDIKPVDDKWTVDNKEDVYFSADSYDCTFLSNDSDIYSIILTDGYGKPVDEMLIRNNLAVSLNNNKSDEIDYDYLIGQKFYAKFLKIEFLSKFYLCLEPLKSNNTETTTDVSVIKSSGPVECSINNLENIISTISNDDFKTQFENKYVIAYVHGVTNRLHVTLYDASTGKKLECFVDDTVTDDSDVICPHPVFNKNLGPSFVSHVESINYIYIQRNKNIDGLASLLDDLYTFYENKEDAETLVSPQINNICVAKSSDDNWYRAKITKVLSDECEVLYVDYGNREAIPINNLKILDEQFYVQPKFAIQCELKNATSDSNVTEEQLKELLLDKEVRVVLNKSDAMPVKWIPTITVGKVNIIDDLFGTVTASESEPNVVQNDVQLDNNSELLTVFVSHIDSPGQFWLQLSSDSQNLEDLDVKLENAESFDDLLKYEIGTQCVAKYSACEKYYRAVILDCDNDIITVRFTDYGNTDVLDNTPGALKCIPKDWPAINPLSIKCSVNASPTGMGEWTEQATELFTESIGDTEKPIQAKIILKDITTYVDLYNNDVNITDVLVNAGHATPAEKLTSAEPLTCYASHVNSASEFWIQLDSSVSDLEKVSDQLIDAENFSPLNDIEEEVICVAKFPEDDCWYRAKIIVKVSDGTEVLFMDYGNASLTNELRNLPDDLKSLPALSRKCSLQKPTNVDAWSKAAEKRFVELAAEGATPFQVVFNASGDISIVDLLIDGKSITDELIALCDVTSTNEDDKDDAYVSVKISNNYGPTDFWIQHTDKIDDLLKLNNELKNIDSFDEYKESEDILNDTICVSLFSDDNLWYRSRVLNRNESSTSVVHIDYGTIAETVSLRKITPELETVPAFARKCSLVNNDMDKNNFIRRVDRSSQFYVKVLDSSSDPISVELYTKDFNNILETFNDVDEEKTVPIAEQNPEPTDNVQIVININSESNSTNLDVNESPDPSNNSHAGSDTSKLEQSDDSLVKASSDNVENNLESASVISEAKECDTDIASGEIISTNIDADNSSDKKITPEDVGECDTDITSDEIISSKNNADDSSDMKITPKEIEESGTNIASNKITPTNIVVDDSSDMEISPVKSVANLKSPDAEKIDNSNDSNITTENTTFEDIESSDVSANVEAVKSPAVGMNISGDDEIDLDCKLSDSDAGETTNDAEMFMDAKEHISQSLDNAGLSNTEETSGRAFDYDSDEGIGEKSDTKSTTDADTSTDTDANKVQIESKSV